MTGQKCHPTDHGFITPHGEAKKPRRPKALANENIFFLRTLADANTVKDQDAEVTDWSS